MILATDNLNSFALFYYVRLDSSSQGSCMFASPSTNSSFGSFSTSLNCTLGGSLVALINAGGNENNLFY
jgi:hypothetical protein